MKWAARLHGGWNNHCIDNLEPVEQWDNDDQFASYDQENDQQNVAPDPGNESWLIHQCQPNPALSHLFKYLQWSWGEQGRKISG